MDMQGTVGPGPEGCKCGAELSDVVRQAGAN